jgi:Flp pilus assembly protein TadD
MADGTSYSFSISPQDFDAGLLPANARTVGSPAFGEEVSKFLRKQFEGFGGAARIVVSKDKIEVTWTGDKKLPDPVEAIVQKLERGQLPEAIVLLRLLLSRQPDDPRVLYNLGMALSDTGQPVEAEKHLRRLVDQAPNFVNARVALGVALFRQRKLEEATVVLREAVEKEPDNPWALRNLGACQLQAGQLQEAERNLRRASEINPQDQQARYGLAQALHMAGKVEEADEEYRAVIGLDEHSRIADLAREARSKIGHSTFREKAVAGVRPDAVMYLLGAMQRFDKMSPSEVQKIGFEIAVLGMKGLDVNDSAQKYGLRSLPGSFSGLHLVCLMYVAFKRIAPERDIGFDLSREYQTALAMHEGGQP